MIIERNEPIRVICINSANTKTLVKGAIYLCYGISSYSLGRYLTLSGISKAYSCKFFKNIDGSSFDTIPDFFIKSNEIKLNYADNYVGQYIKSNTDYLELKKDALYLVKSQNVDILGINGLKYGYNIHNFIMLSNSETRAIKIHNISGSKEQIITGDKIRKFLLYSDKEKISILLNILNVNIALISKSIDITDEFDLVEIMVRQGKKYKILKSEVVEFLKTVNNILEPFGLNKFN